jgi:hypothetical protein
MEIKIPMDRIQDSQQITPVMEQTFKDNGVNIHTHEVKNISDDFKRGVRILDVKATKYFNVPDLPWKK